MRIQPTGTSPHPILFVLGSMEEGGAQTQTLLFLNALDRKRFRPYLYLAHRKGPYLKEVPADVRVESFWETFQGTLRSKLHHLTATTAYARWRHLASSIRKLKIQLVVSQTLLASLDAGHACEMTGVSHLPLVVCPPVDDLEVYYPNSESEQNRAVDWAFRRSRFIISISQGVKRTLVHDLSIPEEKVKVCPNLLDFEQAQQLSGEIKLNWDIDKVHLLTVGRLAKEKGHSIIIDALNAIIHQRGQTNIIWHILGTGPLESELKQQLERLKLTQFVRFHGFVKNPYPYYKHANLFVLSSRYEAFGCVLTEAMSLKCPVLSTNCVGPIDILDDGKYGDLIPIDDHLAMADAIEHFLKHPDIWKQRAETGFDHAKSNFQLEPGMRRLESYFQKALEG